MLQRADKFDELITFDEFCRMVPDGVKADLLDGAIYMASPDTRNSNRLNRFLLLLVGGFVSARKLGGEVFVSRYAFRVSEHYAPEPDIAYVSESRLHLAEELAMNGGPDVAVEIVSRDSRRRDNVDKRELYERAGVQEYWIIDPGQRRTEFLRASKRGFRPIPLKKKQFFHSQAIPGFWLDVNWLFSRPLPSDYDCLQTVLATATLPAPRKAAKRRPT
jgi:Uma2 family endonuclease